MTTASGRVRRTLSAFVLAALGIVLGAACDGGMNGGPGGPGVPGGPGSCDNLAPGDFTCSIGNRTYLLHVPTNLANPAPLVLDSHGLGSSAPAQRSFSGWLQLSDQEGFVVIHPQGVNNSFNGTGGCCSFNNPQDDVGFFRAMVSRTKAAGNIDAQRVIATGFSNGGAISHRVACEAADVFAAIAPFAFSLGGPGGGQGNFASVANACNPSQPITMFQVHGTNDTVADFDMGVLQSLSALNSLSAWSAVNGCTDTTGNVFGFRPNTLCDTRTAGCRGGTQVSLCAVNMAPHFLFPDVAQTGMTIPEIVYPRILQAIQAQLAAGNRRPE